jgi:hypothetical protein
MNRYVVVVVAVALIAAGIVFAACGSSQGASSVGPAPTVPAATTTSPAPAASTAASTTEPAPPTPTPKPELEDGRHFGYVKSVDLGPKPATLVFDLAYLLKGEEANREAAKRGYRTPVDNDYFIVNDNPRLRTLPLSDDLELRLLDWKHCCETFFAGDLARFAASFERKKDPVGNYRGKFSAYELTVEDGVVVRIDEHFFP